MKECEMEDLLWDHPEKFLNEPLKQFQRQPASEVGRADLIFLDRIGRLIVIEIKRDTLQRGAISQIVDYYGMLKARFPDMAVELIIVANRIPRERQLSCEHYDIEAVEIAQKKFRDVAEQIGYVFKSEVGNRGEADRIEIGPEHSPVISPSIQEDFPVRSKIDKGWYYWQGANTSRAYFLAFVNAKGSCSMRRFEVDGGAFLGKEYKSGDYQASFSEYLQSAVSLYVSRQPNLERDCKSRLPSFVLSELKQQSGKLG